MLNFQNILRPGPLWVLFTFLFLVLYFNDFGENEKRKKKNVDGKFVCACNDKYYNLNIITLINGEIVSHYFVC